MRPPIVVDQRLRDRQLSMSPRRLDLERFRAKACPGLDPGWIPVRVKKTRQNKNLEPRSDSIGTEKAIVGPGISGDVSINGNVDLYGLVSGTTFSTPIGDKSACLVPKLTADGSRRTTVPTLLRSGC
jgi:hypothetical protein